MIGPRFVNINLNVGQLCGSECYTMGNQKEVCTKAKDPIEGNTIEHDQ